LKSFDNLGDLYNLFKNRTLGNSYDDLLKNGWKKLEGEYGSSTVFEKFIGKKRFYAKWETNLVHSTNDKSVSYWKLTYGKINATKRNTLRISPFKNFKP